jgi:hypothetical protein
MCVATRDRAARCRNPTSARRSTARWRRRRRRGDQFGGLGNVDHHDGPHPLAVRRRPLFPQNLQTAIVHLAAGVHGRCPLEAEALSQNRIDDVDLDMRVGAQIGDRARGCDVGEEQPFVVPQPGGALRRQIRPAGVTVATNPSRCSRTTRCIWRDSFMAKRCRAGVNEARLDVGRDVFSGSAESL